MRLCIPCNQTCFICQCSFDIRELFWPPWCFLHFPLTTLIADASLLTIYSNFWTLLTYQSNSSPLTRLSYLQSDLNPLISLCSQSTYNIPFCSQFTYHSDTSPFDNDVCPESTFHSDPSLLTTLNPIECPFTTLIPICLALWSQFTYYFTTLIQWSILLTALIPV